MSSDFISLFGMSVGAFGGTIATGTGWYQGNFGALTTVGNSGFVLAAVSGSGTNNISALVGVNYSAPSSFLGGVHAFRLSSGICHALVQP